MTLPASRPGFPTPRHQQVAELACEFFADLAQVDTVLVVNSCARGQATPDSDIDLAVLLDVGKDAGKAPPSPHAIQDLEAAWLAFTTERVLVREFREAGPFRLVHLDVFDGQFVPSVWDEGGGPDTFEIEIGNRVAHAVPIGPTGSCFRDLQSRWSIANCRRSSRSEISRVPSSWTGRPHCGRCSIAGSNSAGLETTLAA